MDSSPAFRLGTGAFFLELAEPARDTYLARIASPELQAVIPVWHHGGDFLDRFMLDLAASWRGWPGDKSWSSLEGALGLHVSMAKTGRVHIRVEMDDPSHLKWRLIANLEIDNGALDSL